MVDDDKIEEWIQGKLDDGIEPERIKKSLRNTGHDPSLVDEIKDPFAGETEEDQSSEEPDEPDESLDQEETDLSTPEDIQQTQSSPEDSENSSGSDFSLPEVNFSLPEFSTPDLGRKSIALVVLTVLIFSVGGIFAFTDVASVQNISSIGDTADDVMNSGGSDICPKVETSIRSASISDGKTWLKVEVSGGSTDTVVEIFEGESLQGSKQKTIDGTSVVIVDGVGTRAVFRPVGCSEGDEVSLT